MVRGWRTITLNDVCVYTSSLLRAASLMRARLSADAFRARRRRGHTLYHLESEHLKFTPWAPHSVPGPGNVSLNVCRMRCNARLHRSARRYSAQSTVLRAKPATPSTVLRDARGSQVE